MPGSESRRPQALGIAAALALAIAIVSASTRGSPVPVGGIERGDAAGIVFFAALAVGFALYAGGLMALRRAGGRLATVCVIAAAIQLIPLGGPLLLSHDVYSYWAYARITSRHDSNPYVVPPARFPSDPATRAVAPGWRETTSVYGPLFTAFSIGVDKTTQDSETVALVFRTVAALAAIGATLLAAYIARRKAFAAAFVGWNPLLAVSFAGGGHSDALMLLPMLGALALASRRRDVAAGGLWVLAAAVKAPALFLLPLQLVRSRRRFWAGCAIAGIPGSLAATLVFGSNWLTLGRLGHNEARYAIPVRLEQFGVPDRAAHLIAAAALVIGALWLLRQALQGRTRLALGACLLVLTTPWLLPWYATWPVALAAVEEDAVAQVLALAIAAYLLSARVPF
ncbi:MAG TPA: glycosyltransferase 87 family protein [Gaiellaceae bacterium]